MFNINFLPGKKFQIEYLKNNHPEVWNFIEKEIKATINGHLLILTFYLVIVIFSLYIINSISESEISNSIKWIFNIVMSIICLICIRNTYKKIVCQNTTYFSYPYGSREIWSEIRTAASLLHEEKVLNEIVSNNIIKKNSKTIAKSRL